MHGKESKMHGISVNSGHTVHSPTGNSKGVNDKKPSKNWAFMSGGSRTPVELFSAEVAKFEPSILGLLTSLAELPKFESGSLTDC